MLKDFLVGRGLLTKFTYKLLNVQELLANDDRLPTSDDCKTSFYQQAIELLTITAKMKEVLHLHTPVFGTPLCSSNAMFHGIFIGNNSSDDLALQ